MASRYTCTILAEPPKKNPELDTAARSLRMRLPRRQYRSVSIVSKDDLEYRAGAKAVLRRRAVRPRCQCRRFCHQAFSTPELMARIRAALRRVPSAQSSPNRVRVGEILIDFNDRTVSRAGVTTHLTPKELDLRGYLGAHSAYRPVGRRTDSYRSSCLSKESAAIGLKR
jgi:hypothetical protein